MTVQQSSPPRLKSHIDTCLKNSTIGQKVGNNNKPFLIHVCTSVSKAAPTFTIIILYLFRVMLFCMGKVLDMRIEDLGKLIISRHKLHSLVIGEEENKGAAQHSAFVSICHSISY